MHEALADRGLHHPVEGDVVVDIRRVIAIEHASQLVGTCCVDLSPNTARHIVPGGGWDIRQPNGRTRIDQGALRCARKAFLAEAIYKGHNVADRYSRPETSTRGWSDIVQRDQRAIGYGIFFEGAARRPLDDHVFTKNDGDFGIIDAARDGQFLERLPGQCFSPNEQSVDRVSGYHIGIDLGTDAIVIGNKITSVLVAGFGEKSLFKRVGIQAHGGIRTVLNSVADDQWSRLCQLDRAHDFGLRAGNHGATAPSHVGIGNHIEENAFALMIRREQFAARYEDVGTALGSVDIVADFDTAPVSLSGCSHQRIGIDTERLIEIAREVNGRSGCTKDLDSSAAAVGRAIDAANQDPAASKLEDRTCIDHQGDSARHIQRRTVAKRSYRRTAETDFVRGIVG